MCVMGGVVSPWYGQYGKEPRMSHELPSYAPQWMTVPLDWGHWKRTSFGGDDYDFGFECINLELPWRWLKGNFS